MQSKKTSWVVEGPLMEKRFLRLGCLGGWVALEGTGFALVGSSCSLLPAGLKQIWYFLFFLVQAEGTDYAFCLDTSKWPLHRFENTSVPAVECANGTFTMCV
eukprot:1340939-Amphidinium_carterae.1